MRPISPGTGQGRRDRDDQLSKARFEFDWNRQFELALDPKRPVPCTMRLAGRGLQVGPLLLDVRPELHAP